MKNMTDINNSMNKSEYIERTSNGIGITGT